MTDYRNLPPVEPLPEWPRYSQTLLKHADACPRAGYLAAKHRSSPTSHEMDRGSLFHAVAERMTLDLLAAGERSFFSEGEEADASMSAAVVDEVYAERPDLHVPVDEKEAVRIMAWHLACTLVVEPERIIGVERKFVADVAGREVSGIIDLALLREDRSAEVWDWKSSLHVPDEDAYRKSFQGRMYGMLLCFGQPVRRVVCDACEGTGRFWSPESDKPEDPGCAACDERGYWEEREPPVGEHVGHVRTREVYPRYVREDGSLRALEHIHSRTDLADFRSDLERLIERIDTARETGLFPAVPGSHCSICPAPHECPLPAALRNHAGVINSMEQAAEAAMWADFTGAKVAAVNRELKNFADANGGRIRYGRDLVREFVMVEGRAVKRAGRSSDWDGLVDAIDRSANEGVPFDVAEWIRPTASTQFRKRTLKPGELEEESTEEVVADERSADEKWGADAPF